MTPSSQRKYSKHSTSGPGAQQQAQSATPSSSQGTATKPTILLISLGAERSAGLLGIDRQLISALNKHAETIQVVTTQAALIYLSETPGPTACLVTHPSIAENSKVVDCLTQYVNRGGRMIVGFSEFLNHLPLPDFAPFFRNWNLPWEAGAYHRSTFALNPAGVPSPLRPNKLFEAYSMKSTSLKNVQPQDRVYVPVAASHVEDQTSRPGKPLTGPLLDECPAAWARVGQGYVGYVGDVNDEEESTRLVLEMCGITISPGDLGPRECAVGMTIHPSGSVEAITETYAERQLVVRTKADYPRRRTREKEVALRAVKRANASRQKRLVAESLKEEGNKFFKEGKFGEAASRYRQAVVVYGPRPVYLTNLAAALLKMRRYKAAYDAARRALFYDAKNVKALYRSGMALKEQGMYDAAVGEFKGVLRQDPSNAAALAALSETIKLTNERAPKGLDLLRYDAGGALWETETVSDSSEYHHEGNGSSCRYLNHDGCRHGSHCRWKHAPDEKSVRDRLGRNVCIAWLLGRCHYDKKCYYAHDRAYLPHGGWWSDRKVVRALGEELETSLWASTDKRYDTDIFFLTLWVKNRWQADEWMSGRFSRLDDEAIPTPGWREDVVVVNATQRDGRFQYEYTMQSGDGTRSRQGAAGREGEDDGDEYGDEDDNWDGDEDDGNDYWDDEEYGGGSLDVGELEKRALNYGFSDDEVHELLCQGVKPWDEDAWDVLRVLRGM